MKDDLPLNGSGFWVPVGGITEIRDHPQVFHALQVGEDFSGVGQEVWENVVDVTLVTTSKDVWIRISSALFILNGSLGLAKNAILQGDCSKGY